MNVLNATGAQNAKDKSKKSHYCYKIGTTKEFNTYSLSENLYRMEFRDEELGDEPALSLLGREIVDIPTNSVKVVKSRNETEKVV